MSLILASRVIQGTLLNGFALRIGLRNLKNDTKIFKFNPSPFLPFTTTENS